MEEELKRLIGPLLLSGASKDQWLQVAGSAWDTEYARLCTHVSSTAAPSVPDSTPSAVETPGSAGKSETSQWACPRCTSKFGQPKVFPRKAELIRHITHKCEQTIEIICGEENCPAKLTRTDHFKEHLRKVHRLSPAEVRTQAGAASIITLPQRAVLGCGFCRAKFIKDPEAYGEHIAGHFKDGLTIEAWSPTMQILSLLYQSKEVWSAWVEILVDRLPGVHKPERLIKFTKETAADFVGKLEKGLWFDAETLRLILWRLFFAGFINDGSQGDHFVAQCLSTHLKVPTSAQDASSIDSGYGASSGQASLRTFESDLRTSDHSLRTASNEVDNDTSTLSVSLEQSSPNTRYATTGTNLDPERTSFCIQTSWFDDTNNDVPMYDVHDVEHFSDVQQSQDRRTPLTAPESNNGNAHGHRRSASEKLKGMWNEARRSLGFAGPSGA